MASGRLRPIRPGGGVVAAADGTSTAVSTDGAAGFWVICDAAAWVLVSDDDTALTSVDNTKMTPIAANALYGPFELMGGLDTQIHVAGSGAAADCVITLV